MKNKAKILSSTMEDYLETIYDLKESNSVARVGEIAERLKVKSSTVNSAVKNLTEQDLVVHEKYGYVSLTKRGKKLAVEVKSKHEVLFRFLSEFLMLESGAAEEEACRIEHSISKETFERLTKFFEFLEEGFPAEKPRIVQLFEIYLRTGKYLKCDRAGNNIKTDC